MPTASDLFSAPPDRSDTSRRETLGGILLLLATALALGVANSRWGVGYLEFWDRPAHLTIAGFTFRQSLRWIVNDVLMVLFFFVIGMEIRRELQHGALSQWQRAILPAAAAMGGMLAPAALYLAIANGPTVRMGWGVPMATDIAFAVGILALLGNRIPPGMRILLLALAIIDDVGAILVIALFYSPQLSLLGILVATVAMGTILAMQRFSVRARTAYAIPAVVVWAGIYAAGIHPTIAGVVVGLATPTSRGKYGRDSEPSPIEALIAMLHPWVTFVILPLFALANAGVAIGDGASASISWRVVLGVTAGLVLGKPLGVLLASWLTLRLGLATSPTGVTARHLVVVGVVAGIGFTMSMFIAQLAFHDASLQASAKLGVLIASGTAAITSLLLGRWLLPAKGATK